MDNEKKEATIVYHIGVIMWIIENKMEATIEASVPQDPK